MSIISVSKICSTWLEVMPKQSPGFDKKFWKADAWLAISSFKNLGCLYFGTRLLKKKKWLSQSVLEFTLSISWEYSLFFRGTFHTEYLTWNVTQPERLVTACIQQTYLNDSAYKSARTQNNPNSNPNGGYRPFS